MRKRESAFDFEKLTLQCEEFIRKGKDVQALKLLHSVPPIEIPRRWRLPLARLSRRASDIALGLRFLAPVVRSHDQPQGNEPTPKELAEYGVLLQRYGAVHEAATLLEKLTPNEAPEALLYRAFCCFNLWEYEKAVPLLQHYLSLPLDSYSRLIGLLNLSSALIENESWEEAESLLLDCCEAARAGHFSRVEGNCLELLAFISIKKRAFEAAENSLSAADRIFEDARTIDRLFIEKCRAILEAQRSRSTKALHDFRRVALSWPHPETVRETDLLLLEMDFENSRFERLYFGTPSRSYRQRIERQLGRTAQSDFYLYGAEGGAEFDVMEGAGVGFTPLKSGGVQHRVLELLTRDFYRPVPVGSLFSALYPNEYFDALTSRTRVHQALRRTRAWMVENALPIAILEESGNYSITFTGNKAFAFKVPVERKPIAPFDVLLNQVRSHFGARFFTASEVKDELKISASVFQRFIEWAVSRGSVNRTGAGRTTSYSVSI